MARTEEATKLCVEAGLDFHLIDAERHQDYMSASELVHNLSFLREIESDIKLILTVNARHLNAFDIALQYSEIINQYGNAGFCFVAGSPAYLSENERELDAGARLTELVSSSRFRLRDAPIFVGSEGLTDLTFALSRDYSTIPFLLLGSGIEDRIGGFHLGSTGIEAAVYCPTCLSVRDERCLIRSLGMYAVRRRWVRGKLRDHGISVSTVKTQLSNGGLLDDSAAFVLHNAIRELALCGTRSAEQKVQAFSSLGVGYVAFLLPEEGPEERHELGRLVSRFSS